MNRAHVKRIFASLAVILALAVVLQTPASARRIIPADEPLLSPETLVMPARAYLASAPVYGYQTRASYPHDPQAFTQGLVYEAGAFYEGTGLYGGSSLRHVKLESGEVTKQLNLPESLFGEGIAVVDDRIIQLTWRARVGFVYDKSTFEVQRQFEYPTEGWGITFDGERLIMSDGSATLHFWDPVTLVETGRVVVHDSLGTVRRLNELEYIDGEVYANIWLTDVIARIDPDSGRVLSYIDLSGLLPPEDRTPQTDVLNGIAYDVEGDRLFVTGKLWPRLFEIDLVDPVYPTYLNRILADRTSSPSW